MPTTSHDLKRVASPTPVSAPNKETIPRPLAPGAPTPDLPPPNLGPNLENPEHAAAQKALRHLQERYEHAVAVFVTGQATVAEGLITAPVVVQIGSTRITKKLRLNVRFELQESE